MYLKVIYTSLIMQGEFLSNIRASFLYIIWSVHGCCICTNISWLCTKCICTYNATSVTTDLRSIFICRLCRPTSLNIVIIVAHSKMWVNYVLEDRPDMRYSTKQKCNARNGIITRTEPVPVGEPWSAKAHEKGTKFLKRIEWRNVLL